jgi:cell division transport system permease protein
MLPWRSGARSERGLLPEGRIGGPMLWIITIMLFLMILASAGGIAVGGAARALGSDIADRLTVQLPEPDARLREGQARAVLAELGKLSDVKQAVRVDDRELDALLDPWLGDAAREADLPVPALIDVIVTRADAAMVAQVRGTVTAVVPNARVDAHAEWLGPLAGLLNGLVILSIGLVVLMALAAGAAVVLAVRSALNTHGDTIAIMHLMGASDGQVAQLFERRIAMDALLGGGLGLAGALSVLLLIGSRISGMGSELTGSATLGVAGWLALITLPLIGTGFAMLVARRTVLSVLRKML